jgi:hypothetical protein
VAVGAGIGVAVGADDGVAVGAAIGVAVGTEVGMAVGTGVGVGPLQAASKLIAIASRRSLLAIRAHLRTMQFNVAF